jgi:transposase
MAERRGKERIFDPYRAEIASLYQAGMPKKEIARKFGMTSGSVLICLRQEGLYDKEKKALPKYMQPQYQPLVEAIVFLREEGLSCPKIARRVNVTAAVVRAILCQQGAASIKLVSNGNELCNSCQGI